MMSSYDYVIVGAGSAGCVLANRLSADPGARVLLLEAGGSDRNVNIRIPAGFPKQFRSKLDWGYVSEPEPNLIGRSMFLPRGKSLGGSSSMNAMIYIRGHRVDYDTWAERGATGWSYPEVLPYFKRAEGNERLSGPYHGTDGPLNVADPTWLSGVTDPFTQSAKAAGIPTNDDFNGAEQEGAGPFQLTQKRGRRWSAADAYLHPVRKERENLTVVTGALAQRLLWEGTRASGVAYEVKGRSLTARAEREVLLAAGAFNSPQLLMLSGVGPEAHLREHGIDVVADSPHVGEHLSDHAMTTVTYEIKSGLSCLVDATHPKYLAQYLLQRGKGKLSSNVGESGAHVRVGDGVPAPDFQILMGAAYYFDNGYRTYPNPAITLAPSYLRPQSEGSVRLRSRDPHSSPAIRIGFLGTDREMKDNIAAIRLAREVAESGPLGDMIVGNIDPGPGVQTDEQIAAWIRAEVQHEYHPSCTCRMGAEGEGVLDEQLRVRGVDGLRVVDCSSFPTIPGGNTNAPAIMLAERASDLIRGVAPLAAEDPAAHKFTVHSSQLTGVGPDVD
jgi:choline dehydrogenase-like flavoprotein